MVVGRLARATAGRPAPIAALDLATLRSNAADLVRRADGLSVRVASKSVRCRSVLAEVLGAELTESGGFRGIMAYSLREALWLAGAGARDVLLAYPTVDRAALAELGADVAGRAAITLMVDDPVQLRIARDATGAQLRICLDIDASLRIGRLHMGVRRSPVRTPEQAARLAATAERLGFAVVGVMTYEAQIAGVPDTVGTSRRRGDRKYSRVRRAMKAASASEIGARRAKVVAAVQAVVGPLEIVNSGGTGSIEVSRRGGEVVTEVSAGSGLYTPALFDGYRAFEARPALFFATDVVRRPAPDIATVFAGGYNASGAPDESRLPVPMWPPGLRLLGLEGAGEVQTPLVGDAVPEIGERVWFRHAKAGELCERFDELHLVDVDGSSRAVPTYRGEGHNFG